MPKEHLTADSFSRDVLDFLLLLHKQDVRYLIVGGEAVIFHGYALHSREPDREAKDGIWRAD
jgi:hypothetical protein